MPSGILHVVRVVGLVHLKLLSPFFKPVGVVERQSALPELRLRIRHQLDEFVKGLGGGRDVRIEEGIHALPKKFVG